MSQGFGTAHLAAHPAVTSLVCATDGSVRDFRDDGCDVDPNTGRVLRLRNGRSTILAAASKKIPKGFAGAGLPLFYWPKGQRPAQAFKGDQLPSWFAELEGEAAEAVRANVTERARRAADDAAKAKPEIQGALRKVAQRNATAAAVVAPTPAGGAE